MAKAKKTKLPGGALEQANPAPKPVEEDPVDNYQTKDHLDTIIKAHGIQQDPDKMEKVHALAGRHVAAIAALKQPSASNGGMKSLDQVRKYAQDTYGGVGGKPKSEDGE